MRARRTVTHLLRLLGLAAVLACLAGAGGDDEKPQNEPANSLFLVAKPALLDPNFAHTVVLVTQTEDASTVGVILNRPTTLKPEEILAPGFPAENYRDRIYSGGPVMRQVLVALFRADKPPQKPAFHVLKDIYLTMHPDNIEKLLKDPKASYRLYAGFSGWAPRQLESEFMRDGWYVLPAEEEVLFRKSYDGLWEELVGKAQRRGPRASR